MKKFKWQQREKIANKARKLYKTGDYSMGDIARLLGKSVGWVHLVVHELSTRK